MSVQFLETSIIVYLVGGIPTPLKNMKVGWDYENPNIWKVIKFMFQTTNQQTMSIMLWYVLYGNGETNKRRVPETPFAPSWSCMLWHVTPAQNGVEFSGLLSFGKLWQVIENLWTFGKPLECVNPYKVTRHAQRFSTAKLGNISNTFKYQPYQHIHERHGRWMSVNIGKAHASRILWALPRIYWLDDPLLLW